MAVTTSWTVSTPEVASTRLHRIVVEFEDALRRGENPNLADYSRFVCGDGLVLLAELALTDLEVRLRRGETVRVESYFGRFPELAGHQVAALALIRREQELRREREPGLTNEGYATRFPEYADLLCQGQGRTTSGQGLPTVPGYELLEELGRGGMGVVFKARHIELKRLVALKMIRNGPCADPEECRRFKAEARAAARLQHPNIVQVYDVGEAGGQPFLAMELVTGDSLAVRLRAGPLAARAAARLAETLARAMAVAHSQRVIHRDLKPANVLLTADGTPKISDFGLAKRLDEEAGQTRHGELLGTPCYMAPEQANGRTTEVGPAADVYGLGALLYELLTARPPFRGATPLETLDHVRAQDPVPPSRVQPRVPRDLETLCLKCLEKNPARRYAGALELADDLGRFLAGEPIRAQPVGPWGRLWRWARRRPYVAGLSAAVFLLLAVLAGGATMTASHLVAAKAELEREAILLEQAVVRERAERERAHETLRAGLKAVNDAYTRASDATAEVAGLQPARKQLLESALEHFQGFVARWGDEPVVHAEVARAWLRVGRITMQVGQEKDALGPLLKAHAMLSELIARQPADSDYRRALASACASLGVVYRRSRQFEPATRYANEAVAEWSAVVRDHADSKTATADGKKLALAYHSLAFLLEEKKQVPGALRAIGRSAEILSDLATRQPDDGSVQALLAWTYHSRGLITWHARHTDESLPWFAKAIDLLSGLPPAEQQTLSARQWLGNTHNGRGLVLLGLGRPDEAEGSLEAAARVREKLVAENPAVTLFRAELATTLQNLGTLRTRQGRTPEAVALFERACTLYERVLTDSGPVAAYRDYLVRCYHRLARTHRAMGDLDRAAEVLLKCQRLAPDDPRGLCQVARELVLCMEAVGRGKTTLTAEDEARHRRFACLAVRTLRRAAARDRAEVAQSLSEPAWAPLLGHADFQQLRSQLNN
jgi:serine/threonine-protein kinase